MTDPGVHLLACATTLASAGAGAREWTAAHSMRLAFLIGLFIVAVVALGIILLVMRRRMLAPENEMSSARTLMEELRGMRDRGEMTGEEYDAARKALAAKVATNARKQAAGTPPASYAPKLPRSAMPARQTAGARTAPPGYDLTGAPLPTAIPSPPPTPEPPPKTDS